MSAATQSSATQNGAAPAPAAAVNGFDGTFDADDIATETKKAADQIAFYFSDVNLPYDRFLFTTSQVSLTATKQLSEPGTGWVSLTTILAFKRMQKYQSTLGRDVVAKAIREHKSQFLKVSQDNTKVARISPIVPPQSDDTVERSVYVKGFPKEEDWTDKPETLQEALEEFALRFGDVNVVRMRREGGNDPKNRKSKPFKGSIFIEFKDKESADNLLNTEPKPTFEGMTEPIMVMRKAEYCEMKAKEKGIPTGDEFKDQLKPGPKKFNAFREMKQGAKRKARQEEEDREYSIEYSGKKLMVDNEGNLVDPSQLEFQRNTVLCFSNVDEENFNFRNMKKLLAEVQVPTFVNKESGESFGLVGFHDPVSDETLAKIEALDYSQTVEVNAGGIKWTRLSEDAERAYHLDRANYYAKQEREKFRGPAHRAGRGQPGNTRGRRGRGGANRANDRTQENQARAAQDNNNSTEDKAEEKPEVKTEVKTEAKMEEDDKSGGTKRALDHDAESSEPSAKKAKTEES